MDAMEHVPAAQRDPFIRELLRVTGRRLFIGCPMGRAAERQDRMLHEYRRSLGAATVESLDEHLEHGLPQLDEVLAAIRAGASGEQRAAEIRTYPNVDGPDQLPPPSPRGAAGPCPGAAEFRVLLSPDRDGQLEVTNRVGVET
jgi:hypothetical protein